jgi:glycosyltransferase involved in cell wall biosynthesis
VVVVDDSREPIELEGVQLVTLPYDSGVSAGRNAGLERVRTKYVLMLDDDLVLYRRSALGPTVALMDRYPDIDLAGGRVLDLPFGLSVDYRRTPLFPTKAEPRIPLGTLIGGLPVYDKVANFYVGRADRIRQVGWEPKLKRLDHRDFFSRARGVLTTVFNADLRCLHVKGHFDDGYLAHRYDMTADQAFLADRWPDLASGMT